MEELMTFDEWLEDQGIAKESYTGRDAAEMARLQKNYMTYFSKSVKKAMEAKNNGTEPDPEALKSEIENQLKSQLGEIETGEGVPTFITRLKELEDFKKKAHIGKSKGVPTKTMAEVVAENKEGIRALVKGSSSKEIELKANTLRSSIASNPSGYFLPNIGQLGVKNPGIYDVLPKITVPDGNHQGLIRYVDWDEATIARAADVVAEAGRYPESTAAFIGRSKELVKIGDTLPVSEEFGTDEVTAAAELDRFLDTNVRTKRDDELINGTGGAGQIEGLVAAAPAYVAAASGIASPNIYDLVKKVRTGIVFDRGSKYSPDIVVMNANTMDEYHLTKDGNQNYMFRNDASVGPMLIIEDNNMADNSLIVGDRRYAVIYEKYGILLSRGMIDDQFAEDMELLKAKTRLLMLIREVDKSGFSKVTDIDAALVTLGS